MRSTSSSTVSIREAHLHPTIPESQQIKIIQHVTYVQRTQICNGTILVGLAVGEGYNIILLCSLLLARLQLSAGVHTVYRLRRTCAAIQL